MSQYEAQQYVDLVIDQLAAWGIISQERYGNITENQRQGLAEQVAAKSEE